MARWDVCSTGQLQTLVPVTVSFSRSEPSRLVLSMVFRRRSRSLMSDQWRSRQVARLVIIGERCW